MATRSRKGRTVYGFRGITLLIVLVVCGGCSDDMRVQPSFQSQEGPRKHSPSKSVPLNSQRRLASPPQPSSSLIAKGQTLFSINCSHCHGPKGMGNGPVAGYLNTLPTNLQAPQIHHLGAEYYVGIQTNGKGAMPAFKKLLSVKERWAIAYFVQTLGPAHVTKEKDEEFQQSPRKD